jgi:hypothetical protein
MKPLHRFDYDFLSHARIRIFVASEISEAQMRHNSGDALQPIDVNAHNSATTEAAAARAASLHAATHTRRARVTVS